MFGVKAAARFPESLQLFLNFYKKARDFYKSRDYKTKYTRLVPEDFLLFSEKVSVLNYFTDDENGETSGSGSN